MKLNLKMIAAAAAMVLAGSAHADLTGANVVGGTGSSLVLLAYNSVTNAYYVRDLGYTLNSFIPSGVTSLPGDGGVTGDKSPSTGLLLDKTTNASFADSAFSTWLTGQTQSDIRWTVTAGDSLTTGANGVGRLILASSTQLPTTQTGNYVSNGTVRNASTAVTSLQGQNPSFTLSTTGATVLSNFTGGNLILQPNTFGTLDNASYLYYFSATTQTGSTATLANINAFGNGTGFASLLLASNGDLSYTLAAEGPPSAVPVPAAAWLMGSGLVGFGGFIRRRRSAAAAA